MSLAVCPGCAAGTEPQSAAAGQGLPTHELVLPGVHCMACIRTVETTLSALPGITSARVNLSRKRVAISAVPQTDPTPWIEALAAVGYEAHEAREGARTGEDGLMLRLGISGFAMMNVMLLSVAVWSGADASTRDLFHWIAALIAVPAALFCAEPFFKKAWSALRLGRLNMDVPISLAILLACVLSIYETATSGEHAYFDAALSLTFFLLAGRVLEARMRRSARSAAADIAALEPRRVIRIEGAAHVSRPVSEIEVGDELWLAAGARVPVDARLCSQSVEVDRSALTGESAPVPCAMGARLMAGDVMLSGPVIVAATGTSQGSTLRRMVHLTALAEGARSRYTSLADRAAGLYAPLVHGLALAAFVGWLLVGADVHWAATVAISTLIITCPCALGLAVPAVATVSTGRLYRAGILVKSETALERMAQIDTVVLDKTGTVTRSILRLPEGLSLGQRQVLKALARASDHPLSKSLTAALADVDAAPLEDLTEITGKGVQAVWGARRVRLGSGAWIGGRGTIFDDGVAHFALEQSEALLPDAHETVAALQKMGLRVHLLTGDRTEAAARIAAKLGCDSYEAEVSPEDKQRCVAELGARGHRVAMVGDGLNDTLALSEAWVSLAPGTALEASQNAADIVLLRDNLSGIPVALRIARASRKRILENFAIAAGYNMISIPLALFGFATPLMAALAMSSSSIFVTLNALRRS